MRKMMTKEVTSTTVKCAKMVTENGMPKAEKLEDIVLLGNVSLEQAQKHVLKNIGQGVSVFEVVADTVTYQMPVEEFIQLASIKEIVEKTEEKELA